MLLLSLSLSLSLWWWWWWWWWWWCVNIITAKVLPVLEAERRLALRGNWGVQAARLATTWTLYKPLLLLLLLLLVLLFVLLLLLLLLLVLLSLVQAARLDGIARTAGRPFTRSSPHTWTSWIFTLERLNIQITERTVSWLLMLLLMTFLLLMWVCLVPLPSTTAEPKRVWQPRAFHVLMCARRKVWNGRPAGWLAAALAAWLDAWQRRLVLFDRRPTRDNCAQGTERNPRTRGCEPISRRGDFDENSTVEFLRLWYGSTIEPKRNESLTVEEMFVQGFCQESTRKTNIYSTAPMFMFFC